MASPFLGEIKIAAWGYPARGWALCNGQLLPISQNQNLFALLGKKYGGDGQTTFGLPDFRGRAPVHVGNGMALGQAGGEEFHTLTPAELPAHTHTVNASSAPGTVNTPDKNVLANSNVSPYRTDNIDTNLAPASVETKGASQPHENRQPYLVLNFMIALQGANPPRN